MKIPSKEIIVSSVCTSALVETITGNMPLQYTSENPIVYIDGILNNTG